MDCELINIKLNITKNGTAMTDLLTQSVAYKSYDFYIIDSFYIGEDLEMRADLLSQAIYGNTHNWDVILKFNGISNPFAIAKEDFIIIPELGWMDTQLASPTLNDTSQDIRSQYIDASKTTGIDAKKQEYNKLIKDLYNINKNASFNKIALSPNLAQFGDTEVKKVGTEIILGPNVTATK